MGVFELCFGFKLWQVSGAIGAFGFEFLSDLAPVGTLLLALLVGRVVGERHQVADVALEGDTVFSRDRRSG